MRSLLTRCFVALGFLIPLLVSAAKPMVAAGNSHTVALKADGTTWAWGYNFNGQLGIGTTETTPRSSPLAVPGLTGINAVSAGRDHNVALNADGTLWTWGWNNDGQLGDGTTTQRNSPVPVPGLTGIVAVSGGGGYHTVALKAGGTVWAWGNNDNGQLGDGTTTQRTSPVAVPGLAGIIAVTGGGHHTVALKSDGTVWTWGSNGYGQLGDMSLLRASPEAVPGLTGVVAVAAGNLHTVALKGDGTLWAWGLNQYGQIGNGTTSLNQSPVAVPGLTGIIAVAAGEHHTVALKADGTVWAWGDNIYGALGDGTTTDRTSPVAVPGLTGIVAVAAGTFHTFAIKADGAVWGWGYNGYGQVGDGTDATYRSSPVLVMEGTPLAGLVNLSTRGQVQTGDNVMIGGFIIGGSTPKKVLIRAVGPNLANYGVSGVLLDPTLQLYSGPSVIASNDNWSAATNAAAITATGLAPVNALESAILTTLSPGAYTAIVSGNGGGTGVGIVEVYEVDNPGAPFTNISTRGQVQTGDNVMIGGFIIQGTTSQTVLIRAVGPNLANYGVAGVLDNPGLRLYSGQTVIASNDDWGTASNAAAITATGLAPANSLESAILVTLPPGAYTAVVSGANGGTGVGIIEVFAQ